MKKTILELLMVFMFSGVYAQTDTNYTTRISSLKWMPDGKSILLGVVKHHKANHEAPFFSKVFLYTIQRKKLAFLFDDGSNFTTSPDGNIIAFMKRSKQANDDIYSYNITTKKQTVIKSDTLRKYGLTWSPDGKKLAYNILTKAAGESTVNIFILDLATKQVKQITQNGKHKSFDPQWSPDSKRIVYYLEKDDGRDQIWLTDINGSFHTNLTNDTTTHNYYPSWIDDSTIIYTQSPEKLMMMRLNESNPQKIEGIDATPVRYNKKANQFIYIKSEEENRLMLFDWKTNTAIELIDGTKLGHLF